MYLARKHTKMSSAEVGRLTGKNHVTVLMGCRKIEELLERNGDIHWYSPDGHRVAKARDIFAQLEDSIRS
jgi:hypothetical protein